MLQCFQTYFVLVLQIIFSFRFRTAINVLGDSIGAGIVNHLSKVGICLLMISVAFMILVMVFMLTGGADPLGQARAGVATGADGGEGGEEGGADLILQIYIMLQIYENSKCLWKIYYQNNIVSSVT